MSPFEEKNISGVGIGRCCVSERITARAEAFNDSQWSRDKVLMSPLLLVYLSEGGPLKYDDNDEIDDNDNNDDDDDDEDDDNNDGNGVFFFINIFL